MFEDYMSKFHQWGLERQIITNGKADTQLCKLLSEMGEMFDNMAKGRIEALKDDIGDQVVVLAMIAGLVNYHPEPTFSDFHGAPEYEAQHLLDLYGSLHRHLRWEGSRFVDSLIDESLETLHRIATAYGLEFEDCLAMAWSEIKDRKGYLNAEGVFIKEVA